MSRVKYYHVYGSVYDKKGEKHTVTVVGKFEQSRVKVSEKETIDVWLYPSESVVMGELNYKVKKLKRKLTLGLSICHPMDKFSESKGVEIARNRINSGQAIGSLETNDVTMLTEDAIMGELMVKLNYILGNIDDYITEDDEFDVDFTD